MSRQGSSEPPISLFSFQDIITSLTGVLFLVMILLALFLCETKLAAPERAAAEAAAKRRQELAAELDAAKRRLAETTARIESLGGLKKLDLLREMNRLREEEKKFSGELRQAEEANRVVLARKQEQERRKREQSERSRTLDTQLERTRQRLTELQALQETAARKLRVAESVQRFRLSPADSAVPIFLLLKEREVVLTDPSGGESVAFSGGPGAKWERLKADLTARCTTERFLLFFVQPSAFPYFSELLQECRTAGFTQYGAEVLPDDGVEIQITKEDAP